MPLMKIAALAIETFGCIYILLSGVSFMISYLFIANLYVLNATSSMYIYTCMLKTLTISAQRKDGNYERKEKAA